MAIPISRKWGRGSYFITRGRLAMSVWEDQETNMLVEICHRAEVLPEETVHVGDEPETDIAGATAAGFRTI